MKVLVTGASGFIGRVLAESLSDHDLLLWSRTQLRAGPRAEYFASDDLRNTAWWQNAELPQGVDAVIHLAEPVKTKFTGEAVEAIVSSHRAFLEQACTRAQLVIYPNTAYRYDGHVGKKNRQYLRIKTEVVRKLCTRANFVSPVIHPLIDSNGSLARLVEAQSRLPILNPFCSFKARIPVLTVPELVAFFQDQLQHTYQLHADWYHRYPAIADLTRRSDRRDWAILSEVLKLALLPLSNSPSVSILMKGREIP